MSSSRARTIPESFRVFLLKLLLDHGDGISVAKFASHFMKSRGDRIKYELYGYSSLIDMLEDLPDVCRVDRTSNTVMLYPVDDALKIRLRYQLDKRPAKPEDPELDSIRKVATSLGEVILLKIEDEIYVPTCCLAQLAGCTTDRVLETLEEDGLKVSNVRYLTVGNKEHEEFRLRIALWCPLACSDPQQIDEKLAVVPLASCDFILGSMIPDIPQDNAVRKLRILSSFRLNYV